jgi:hypothetical protein
MKKVICQSRYIASDYRLTHTVLERLLVISSKVDLDTGEFAFFSVDVGSSEFAVGQHEASRQSDVASNRSGETTATVVNDMGPSSKEQG